MRLKDNGKYNDVYGKSLIGFHLIAGKEISSTQTFDSLNPACQNDIVGVFPEANLKQAEMAYQAAKSALPQWQSTFSEQGPQILESLKQSLNTQIGSWVKLFIRESGLSYQSGLESIQSIVKAIHCFQTKATSKKTLQTESLGVVVLISETPSPLIPTELIRALFTGHTVVWKPHQDLPATSYLLSKLLAHAGLPIGTLNLIYGEQSIKQYLLDLSISDKATKPPQTIASPQLEHTQSIMSQVDLEQKIRGFIQATLGSQNPSKIGTLLVHQSIFEKSKKKLLAQVQKIPLGDPSFNHKILYGPLICPQQIAHTNQTQTQLKKHPQITLIQSRGRISRNNKPLNFVGDPDLGFYIWPTVIQTEMTQESILNGLSGPLLRIIKVKNEGEAKSFISRSQGHLEKASEQPMQTPQENDTPSISLPHFDFQRLIIK